MNEWGKKSKNEKEETKRNKGKKGEKEKKEGKERHPFASLLPSRYRWSPDARLSLISFVSSAILNNTCLSKDQTTFQLCNGERKICHSSSHSATQPFLCFAYSVGNCYFFNGTKMLAIVKCVCVCACGKVSCSGTKERFVEDESCGIQSNVEVGQPIANVPKKKKNKNVPSSSLPCCPC